MTTYRALQTSLSNPRYDRLVWAPDALGSIATILTAFATVLIAAKQ